MTKQYDVMPTHDPQVREILRMAENVAASRASILICGESGTGKEVLARYIHEKSSRRQQRFCAINCAAVPEGLLESELFGHERGAFTGASATKSGKFEWAHNGTFLLDEISEMPLMLQAKILRVLQEGEFERVGGLQTIRVNVRVIATTNRDLRSMVSAGLFREDLYYRLNVIPLTLPPLRMRPADIEYLAQLFVSRSSAENGKNIQQIDRAAIEMLKSWSWPGNVRELQNVIERAVLLAPHATIAVSDISIAGYQPQNPVTLAAGMTVSQVERELIFKTLEHTHDNRTQAAHLLGISIRTLRNKLHEYRMEDKP